MRKPFLAAYSPMLRRNSAAVMGVPSKGASGASAEKVVLSVGHDGGLRSREECVKLSRESALEQG